MNDFTEDVMEEQEYTEAQEQEESFVVESSAEAEVIEELTVEEFKAPEPEAVEPVRLQAYPETQDASWQQRLQKIRRNLRKAGFKK